MIPKNATTTTEALAEDIQRVQGIGDNDKEGSGYMMGLVDLQRQWRVDLLDIGLLTVTLSRLYLVAVLF